MTNYQKEQLENIRRTAERGKALSEKTYLRQGTVDCFIHILDLIQEVKNDPYYTEESVGVRHEKVKAVTKSNLQLHNSQETD